MHPLFRIIQDSLRHFFDPVNPMDQGASVDLHFLCCPGNAAFIFQIMKQGLIQMTAKPPVVLL